MIKSHTLPPVRIAQKKMVVCEPAKHDAVTTQFIQIISYVTHIHVIFSNNRRDLLMSSSLLSTTFLTYLFVSKICMCIGFSQPVNWYVWLCGLFRFSLFRFLDVVFVLVDLKISSFLSTSTSMQIKVPSKNNNTATILHFTYREKRKKYTKIINVQATCRRVCRRCLSFHNWQASVNIYLQVACWK